MFVKAIAVTSGSPFKRLASPVATADALEFGGAVNVYDTNDEFPISTR